MLFAAAIMAPMTILPSRLHLRQILAVWIGSTLTGLSGITAGSTGS
ncbi:hypothetical protein FHT93_003892 [Rhizobium sp. BK379]|jgi:hypothetical protein|nr:hypothetical protein [Rhizobium sp. BK379]